MFGKRQTSSIRDARFLWRPYPMPIPRYCAGPVASATRLGAEVLPDLFPLAAAEPRVEVDKYRLVRSRHWTSPVLVEHRIGRRSSIAEDVTAIAEDTCLSANSDLSFTDTRKGCPLRVCLTAPCTTPESWQEEVPGPSTVMRCERISRLSETSNQVSGSGMHLPRLPGTCLAFLFLDQHRWIPQHLV